MACKACGGDHRGWERCRKPAEPIPQAANAGIAVVHAVVHKESRHGKYADMDKRREYRRNWMRAKRATAARKD